MIKNKIGIGIILLTMLVGMALIPAVSAQKEDNYSVTAEEAFKHANANMISFIAAKAPNFENWTGASIDPKPVELYDINGQKLFYQFSVYKEKKLIGTIDIYANKMLGHSFNDIAFNPIPYKATEAMKKSKEIAKKNYPTGEIKSTNLVVYSYPSIGAMTVVKDRTTGVRHRIFVDAYTLEEVQDKPASETELGVWSMCEQRLKNGIDENLNEWQKSDQLTKSIEQAATNKGVNINVAVTEEDMKKLSGDAAITSTTSSNPLSVPIYAQLTGYYCVPASASMIGKYFGVTHTQDYIYNLEDGEIPYGLSDSDAVDYCRSYSGLSKRGSYSTSSFTASETKSEIDNGRPYFSFVTGHCRACKGYYYSGGTLHLILNDPQPVMIGTLRMEAYGSEVRHVYVRD